MTMKFSKKKKHRGERKMQTTTNEKKQRKRRENAKIAVGKYAEREGASETEKKNKKKS